MKADYLDLLLDRATGSIPLAEPRINPTTIGPSNAPQWEEISEEAFRPNTAPSNVQQRETSDPQKKFRSFENSSEIESQPEPRDIFPRKSEGTHHEGSQESPEPVTSQPAVFAAREEWRREPPPSNPLENSASSTSAPSVAAQTTATEPSNVVERVLPAQRWFPDVARPDYDRAPHQPLTIASTERQVQSPAPISIRIDRIEVRAGGPAPRTTTTPKPQPHAPLGLDEYLKRKNGGAR